MAEKTFIRRHWINGQTPAISADNMNALDQGIYDLHYGERLYCVVADGAGHYIKLPKLTSTERDNLTQQDGLLIWNSTTGNLIISVSGQWRKFHLEEVLLSEITIDGDISMEGHRITNLGASVNDQDAVTKAYVSASQLDPDTGMIVMWSGTLTTIPSGWYLCDGNNGTPNMLDKFIMGAATAGSTGGTTSKSVSSHQHTVHTCPQKTDGTYDAPCQGTTSSAGDTVSDIRPPYYELAYIMKGA